MSKLTGALYLLSNGRNKSKKKFVILEKDKYSYKVVKSTALSSAGVCNTTLLCIYLKK